MGALHDWYIRMPMWLGMAILCGIGGTLAIGGAWMLQRNEVNAKEQRLAAELDRAAAKLKRHRVAIYIEAQPKRYAVGSDVHREYAGKP